MTESAIESFFGYFEQEFHRALQVESRLHRKVLLATMLAALAEGRYPSEDDKTKFTKLVNNYGDWPEGRNVSVEQLKYRIESLRQRPLTGGGLTDEFVNGIESRHLQWQQELASSVIRAANLDPPMDRLLTKSPTNDEKAALRESTHTFLLYQYRSGLVHEFREIGGGFELDERETKPYYMPTTYIDDATEKAELTYPLGLLASITRAVLRNLKAWYLANDIDPYSRYRFGSSWQRR
jgi:hypothetical protein